MTLAAKIAALDIRAASKEYRNERVVHESGEFRRVFSLPRRPIQSKESIEAFASQLTERLKKPNGTMQLRPIQALALAEIHDTRGFLGALRVGSGKTGVTALAPTVLGVKKSVLFVPASLVRKTQHDFDVWSKHFNILHLPRVLSYEWLSRVSADRFFEIEQPELVIADECHRFKNTNAACTRRIARYFTATEKRIETDTQRNAVFVGVSGTVTKRSLRDFAHLADWATRHTGNMPLPRGYHDLIEWCGAIDEKLQEHQSYDAGALEQHYDDGERGMAFHGNPRGAARSCVARRIHETPGFLSTRDDVVPIAITIDFDRAKQSDAVKRAIDTLRNKWITPSGVECTSPIELWRHERELALGFCYRWIVPGPREWLAARTAWAGAVQKILRKYTLKLDSPFAITRAIQQGVVKDADVIDAHAAWSAVKQSFEPETVPEWIDTGPLEQIAARCAAGDLVWIEHRAIGERLAKDFGVAYHSDQSLDGQGRTLESKKPGDKLALSIASCSTGRNLQAWSTNYVVTPPTSGAAWEQLLGRTHRDGQTADEVRCTVRLGSEQGEADFAQARADAAYLETVQGQPQKLVLATYADE